MIKQNQRTLNGLFVIFDAITILASFSFSWYIRFQSGIISIDSGYLSFQSYLKPIILIIPLYLLVNNIFHLYSPYRVKNIYNEFIEIIKANTIVIFAFIMLLFFFKEIDYSRVFLFIAWVSTIISIFIERGTVRFILRKLRKNNYNIKHIILIGFSEVAYEFIGKVMRNKQWGYRVTGIISDDYEIKSNSQTYKGSINNLGKISALKGVLETNDIDEVFITLDIKDYDKLGSIISVCENVGVRTQIIPSYIKYIPARPYVEEVEGLPIINIRYIPLDSFLNNIIKRAFDTIGSIVCVLVFSPILLFTAILIKCTSTGPILFKQERVGYNKKLFQMYKFRTMEVQSEEDESGAWTSKDDPRKTKFGSFLRKTSIDELPQLFNVIKGDMSLVGPRPERPFFVDKFKDEIPKYMIKHQVRPGMTGWAQVNGYRGDTSIEERIKCDIYYIENWSLFLDLKIFWLTIFKGFVNKNAY